MKITQFDAEYSYGCDLDIVNIKVMKNYDYSESITFDSGVFFRF